MSIQNITDKFYARMTADNGAGGLANATGGVGSRIYPVEGRQDAALPHLSFFVLASTPIRSFNGVRTDEVRYQVDIFADKRLGADAAHDIADKVFTLFDNVTFASAPTNYDRAISRVTTRGMAVVEEDAIRVTSEVTVLATDF